MSILNVNKINPVGGGSTITIAGIASVTGSVTAPSFVGNVTGNSDTASGLSGNPSINTTGIVTATSFVPTVGQFSHRNIVINGAMNVSQRGSSYTGTNSYGTVDRMACSHGGTDESPTQAQVDVASGTTPYTLGFRKAFKITNGNQTSGLGAGDLIQAMRYRVEAQDMANCGWNYTDPNSFITLSFWVKSSVSFNMKGYFFHHDGTTQSYPLETGTLTADTWTKIERKIPGNSNVTFDNNNDVGLTIAFGVFGTNFSSANPPVNQWVTYSSATLTNPSETTWYTTNDATLEFTGLQLEVGSVATPFEHLSFGDELRRCQRYYHRITAGGQYGRFANGQCTGSTESQYFVQFPVTMRGAPSFGYGGTIVGYTVDTVKTISGSITIGNANQNTGLLTASLSGLTAGNCVDLIANNDTTAYVEFISEL